MGAFRLVKLMEHSHNSIFSICDFPQKSSTAPKISFYEKPPFFMELPLLKGGLFSFGMPNDVIPRSSSLVYAISHKSQAERKNSQMQNLYLFVGKYVILALRFTP